MIEEKIISADTRYKTDPADDLTLLIKVEKASASPNTIEAALNLNSGVLHTNNVEVLPGEANLVLKNKLKDIDFEINIDGELIVNGEDADNYSLDENGNLIYTYR